MTTIKYDGTFLSLLSAIYDIYLLKINDPLITSRFEKDKVTMFGETIECKFEAGKASKVRKKINSLSNKNTISFLYHCFLSEELDVEQLIYLYCKNLLDTNGRSSNDYGINCTYRLKSLAKKVRREKHRMKAFIRFQEIETDLYFANCKPVYDVIPLITSHFESRL